MGEDGLQVFRTFQVGEVHAQIGDPKLLPELRADHDSGINVGVPGRREKFGLGENRFEVLRCFPSFGRRYGIVGAFLDLEDRKPEMNP